MAAIGNERAAGAADVLGRLASAQGRRDEQPNIALAEEIAASGDGAAVAALVAALDSMPRPAQHDIIKVLYEAAERDPQLLVGHLDAVFGLLRSRDNRMLWGALSLLAAVAAAAPEPVMAQLDGILDAADRSSVIAKDKAMAILAVLNGIATYQTIVSPVILARLRFAAVNQTPMYAELAARTWPRGTRAELAQVVADRLSAMSYPAKRRRLQKVLRELDA